MFKCARINNSEYLPINKYSFSFYWYTDYLLILSMNIYINSKKESRISYICSLFLKRSRSKQVYVDHVLLRQYCESRSLPKQTRSWSFDYASCQALIGREAKIAFLSADGLIVGDPRIKEEFENREATQQSHVRYRVRAFRYCNC